MGLILIILPVYSKFSQLLTSWPIIGGAIASGVFLMLIAIAGIYGAARHNQITLFFVSLTKYYICNQYSLLISFLYKYIYICYLPDWRSVWRNVSRGLKNGPKAERRF